MTLALLHRHSLIPVLVFSVFLLGGCSGTGHTTAGGEQSIDAPSWYRNPPSDSAHVTVTATATSRRKKVAIGKAVNSARTELADTLQNIVDRARRGGGMSSFLEAKLDASPAVQIPVDSLLGDVEGTPVSQSGCGGPMRCGEFSTPEELQEQRRKDGPSPLRTATTRRTEARKTGNGTWRGFALVALPVEAVATALRQAAGDE